MDRDGTMLYSGEPVFCDTLGDFHHSAPLTGLPRFHQHAIGITGEILDGDFRRGLENLAVDYASQATKLERKRGDRS